MAAAKDRPSAAPTDAGPAEDGAPGTAARPAGGVLEPVLAALQERYADAIVSVTEHRGERTVELDRRRLLAVCTFLRDDPGARFRLLSDLSGTDYLDRPDRLCVDYHLYSFELNARLRLKVRVSVEDPVVPSVTGIWPTANFHEREVYDMFGVRFHGHPELIRILMPEDWRGHPQRKDYPLGGVDVDYLDAHIAPPSERSYRGGWTST